MSHATTYLPPRQPHQPVQRIAKWALITVSTVVIVGALYLFFRGTQPRYVKFMEAKPAAHVSPIADGWVQGLPDQPVAPEPPPRPQPPVDEEARVRLAALSKQVAQYQEANSKQLEEIRKLLAQQKPATAPAVKRAPVYFVTSEHKPQDRPANAVYTLPAWTYIPCVLENVLNSEIEGMFTVRTTRPTLDVTGTHVLIPQGQRIGAKDTSASLLYGHERIPTWALSVSMPDGSALELGEAPIMDAAGTNGLTGDVDNHTWRLVWTSVFIGGLQGGQQVLQTELGANGAGPIAAGIARQGSSATQQRLGRAQDTRPTITVHAGDQCNVLVPKALSLPAVTVASR
jgi:type IV secretory pathway VirB10-like protein